MTIQTKMQMRDLFQRGKFGNRPPSWSAPDFLRLYGETQVPHPVGLMYNDKPGTKLPRYTERLFTIDEVKEVIGIWLDLGCRLERITVSGGGSWDANPILQGEVQYTELGYDLLYTTAPGTMREAMAIEQRTAAGLKAKLLIWTAMDDQSWDCLMELINEYPGHVIEFSCFDKSVGELGWNTIFWEVRHY